MPRERGLVPGDSVQYSSGKEQGRAIPGDRAAEGRTRGARQQRHSAHASTYTQTYAPLHTHMLTHTYTHTYRLHAPTELTHVQAPADTRTRRSGRYLLRCSSGGPHGHREPGKENPDADGCVQPIRQRPAEVLAGERDHSHRTQTGPTCHPLTATIHHHGGRSTQCAPPLPKDQPVRAPCGAAASATVSG